MPRRPRATGASDIPVLIWAVVIGLLGTFGLNLAWPGVLIFAAIAGAIWFGWKLNPE